MKHWALLASASTLAGLVAFPGCTVGPNYSRPEVAVQRRWSQAPLTRRSVVDQTAPPAAWWATLNDPKLNMLIECACDGNLSIAVAKSRIWKARAERSIAVGGLLPSASSSAGYSFNRGTGPLFPGATGDYQFYTTGFDAVWEADIFGGIRRSVEAAQDELDAQQDAERGAVVSIIAEVARNYVELRTAQQRVLIARENIRIQTETAALATRLRGAGIVGDLDVARARAELTQTQSQVPTLDIQVKAAIHRLGILLGEAPEALLAELDAPGAIPAPPGQIPIGLPSELLRRRPDIRQAERQLAASTARIGVAEADLYPQLTLTGSFGVGSERLAEVFNWSNRYYGIGPAVRWQLFEGGRIVANVQAHKAVRQELLDQYKLTILTAFGEAEDALVAFNRQQEQHQFLSHSVESNQESVRIAREQYAGGTIGYLSLLDAQRSLLKTQESMTLSQGDITLSMIALYKAIGGGWEKVEQDERSSKPSRGNPTT